MTVLRGDRAEGRVPACRGMSPVLFVGPDGGEDRSQRSERERKAKLVCAGCSLRPECLEWAIEHGEKGVWGGTNVEDRRVIKRRRARGSTRGDDGLTDRQRARIRREELAWTLYLVGDRPVSDIALVVGVSLDTAYTYIKRQKRVHSAEADTEAETSPTPSHGYTRYAESEWTSTTVLTTGGLL